MPRSMTVKPDPATGAASPIDSSPRAEAYRLCSLQELPVGATRFEVAGHRLAVVRIGDDVYAIGDRCTHQDVSLSEGEVYEEDAEIECERHGSTFSLLTGEPQCLPATQPTPVYRVEVIAGDIYVEVDE